MNNLETCTGYACPPTHSVPAGDVIVRTVQDTLAVTGGSTDAALWVIGAFFLVAGAVLFTYNHLKRKGRDD